MSKQLILLIVLILVLIPPTIEDLRTREIRNIYFFFLILMKAIYLFVFREEKSFLSSFVSLLSAILILLLCRIVSKEGMGVGDIKLLIGIAFYLGFELFLRDLFLISLGSLLFSLFLLATKQANRKTELPFVPLILLGTIVTTLIEVVY
ncbi:MAG: prepilin peptidase [Clostridia bacterium]|nr:prepilin peptidase [Clostridia bacterium]